MRLEQLEYFRKVAELRSIRKAAEALYLTPQSLSKSLMQLEEELGVVLYDRSRTGIRLTREGGLALEQASRILEQVEILKNSFREEDNSTAPVTLFSSSSMEMFAMGILNQNLCQYPQVPIQVGKLGATQINQMLLRQTNAEELPDLVLTHCAPSGLERLRSGTASNYASYLLFEDTLCLQVTVNDPLAQYDTIPSSILVDLPLLLYSPVPTERTESEKFFAKLGFELRNVSRMSNFETTSRNAVNQHRYCFVGFPSVEFLPMSGVTYIPLEAGLITKQLLMVKKSRKNRPFTDAFVRSMDEYYDVRRLW